MIIMMVEQVLFLMDPMGKELIYQSKLHKNWSLFLWMTSRKDKGVQWKTTILKHSNQQDCSSCGVLILMFAKEFLKTRQISTVQTSAEAAMEAQLHIARTLLVYKGAA
ncbi:hypothetical protein AB205_0180710 [Aquarana catesbeiana]|uniref:Ubiquitin-like protease family profile domain-containing protein n=1 Tax=Aquarana catesbeiana TaxID=8400 RepID=A0A2G9QEY7_AQUCT|nr:hypothetical protein AB205_0180710 [Aquarana catesbeiana]